jgi:hypothetical protein
VPPAVGAHEVELSGRDPALIPEGQRAVLIRGHPSGWLGSQAVTW